MAMACLGRDSHFKKLELPLLPKLHTYNMQLHNLKYKFNYCFSNQFIIILKIASEQIWSNKMMCNNCIYLMKNLARFTRLNLYNYRSKLLMWCVIQLVYNTVHFVCKEHRFQNTVLRRLQSCFSPGQALSITRPAKGRVEGWYDPLAIGSWGT